MNTKIMDLLQAPFEADQIEWRVGSTTADKEKGLALAYVTNRAIQNRLDDTFGCFGWKNEFREWKTTSQICGISVWNEDTKEWITKWDGSDDSATEAVKGGLSDSMKRCGYQWGIGRYLYNLPQIWVPLKNKKYLAETPKLPAWALPHSDNTNKTTDKPIQAPKQQLNVNLSAPPTDGTVTTEMLINMAATKGFTEEQICKKFKTKEAKFIKKEDKKAAYENFKKLPDKLIL